MAAEEVWENERYVYNSPCCELMVNISYDENKKIRHIFPEMNFSSEIKRSQRRSCKMWIADKSWTYSERELKKEIKTSRHQSCGEFWFQDNIEFFSCLDAMAHAVASHIEKYYQEKKND